MKQITGIVSFLTLLFFMSCSSSQDHENFTIKGKVKGYDEKLISLEELNFHGATLIDTAITDKNGYFELSNTYKEPGLYRLSLGDDYLLFILDDKNISIQADIHDLIHYTSTGSKGTASLIQFQNKYFELNQEVLALQIAHDSLSKRGATDSSLVVVQNEINEKGNDLIHYIKQYSDTTKSLPAAIFSASKLFPFSDQTEYLQSFATGLSKRFEPNTLSRDFLQAVNERAQMVAKSKSGPQIGSMAPDFSLQSVDGKEISLSSFKGQFVLLDFWASWCPPCRAENPNVVAVFNKYKTNNFTILGVSLDEKKDKWQEAIQVDQLKWAHVSDLKGWESNVASQYGIQSIPANFLIDPSGKIIAKDLRGAELEKTIQQKIMLSESK